MGIFARDASEDNADKNNSTGNDKAGNRPASWSPLACSFRGSPVDTVQPFAVSLEGTSPLFSSLLCCLLSEFCLL
jgi:hypothetical protein